MILHSKHKSIQIILICTIIFIGMAIPFKVMQIIEGLTEVRPVNAIPAVVGLLFGPLGAIGCALGNLISDLIGGTFSPIVSIFGMWANFVAAYLPYKLWHLLLPGEPPNVKTWRNLLCYIAVVIASSLCISVILSGILNILDILTGFNFFYIIFLNDSIFPIILGLPVFIVLTTYDSKLQPILPCKKENRKMKYIALGITFFCCIVLLFFELFSINILVPYILFNAVLLSFLFAKFKS